MKFFILFLLLAQLVVFGSCSSFPPNSSETKAWKTMKEGRARATVQIISVDAERSGEWGSLEKEISGLLPLLFLEKRYQVVSPNDSADFIAEVRVREREYVDGWRTRRSASAEVRLWENNREAGAETFFEQPLPLSAGRSMIHGRKSIASSKTLTAMLRKAVSKAVNGLPAVTRQQETNENLNTGPGV